MSTIPMPVAAELPATYNRVAPSGPAKGRGIPTLHRQDNGARLAVLPSGHVIEELLNGGSIVHILLYGSVPCRETFVEALALFEGAIPCAHK